MIFLDYNFKLLLSYIKKIQKNSFSLLQKKKIVRKTINTAPFFNNF